MMTLFNCSGDFSAFAGDISFFLSLSLSLSLSLFHTLPTHKYINLIHLYLNIVVIFLLSLAIIPAKMVQKMRDQEKKIRYIVE
jgi:hypothetical protein